MLSEIHHSTISNVQHTLSTLNLHILPQDKGAETIIDPHSNNVAKSDLLHSESNKLSRNHNQSHAHKKPNDDQNIQHEKFEVAEPPAVAIQTVVTTFNNNVEHSLLERNHGYDLGNYYADGENRKNDYGKPSNKEQKTKSKSSKKRRDFQC